MRLFHTPLLRSRQADRTDRKRYFRMSIEAIKYYTCSADEEEGILLVDVESEAFPDTDAKGNLQYYCPAGHHIFSVDEDEMDEDAEK